MTKDGHIGIAKNTKNPINPISKKRIAEVNPNTYNAIAVPIKVQPSQISKAKAGKLESEMMHGYGMSHHYQNNGETFGK